MATKQAIYNHVDAIGRQLKVGDPVAVPDGLTSLMIGRITSMGEKQIRVVKYGKPAIEENRYTGKTKKAVGKLRYPSEAVLIDGPDILVYLLKFSAKTK